MPEKTLKMTKDQWSKLTQPEKAAFEKALRAELIACGDIRTPSESEKPVQIKVAATGE